MPQEYWVKVPVLRTGYVVSSAPLSTVASFPDEGVSPSVYREVGIQPYRSIWCPLYHKGPWAALRCCEDRQPRGVVARSHIREGVLPYFSEVEAGSH